MDGRGRGVLLLSIPIRKLETPRSIGIDHDDGSVPMAGDLGNRWRAKFF